MISLLPLNQIVVQIISLLSIHQIITYKIIKQNDIQQMVANKIIKQNDIQRYGFQNIFLYET